MKSVMFCCVSFPSCSAGAVAGVAGAAGVVTPVVLVRIGPVAEEAGAGASRSMWCVYYVLGVEDAIG